MAKTSSLEFIQVHRGSTNSTEPALLRTAVRGVDFNLTGFGLGKGGRQAFSENLAVHVGVSDGWKNECMIGRPH